jgi:FkbM family methyltransferase
MIDNMKKFIAKVLNRYGFQLINLNSRRKWLFEYEFKTVLDIGANIGQSAIEFRNKFPNAKIYSFEPITSCFNILNATMSKDHNFKAFNFALGEFNEETKIFMNDTITTSSLLETNTENDLAINIGKSRIEKIVTKKLDEVESELDIELPMLCKIDVQGFEDKVIKGGSKVLRKADVVILEVSFEEVYKNQPKFDNIYKLMVDEGFLFFGNYDQLHSPVNGRIIQADAIFLNKNKL